MNTLKQVWDKTAGYKTASGGAMLLLFQLFKLLMPHSMGPQWQDWTYNAIGVVAATGVLDKVWRSRKELFLFIKNLFTKKKSIT